MRQSDTHCLLVGLDRLTCSFILKTYWTSEKAENRQR